MSKHFLSHFKIPLFAETILHSLLCAVAIVSFVHTKHVCKLNFSNPSVLRKEPITFSVRSVILVCGLYHIEGIAT